jgi:allantoate deiminase
MTDTLPQNTAANAEWALSLCSRIAACTDTPGTITRLFLSPATRKVHALLRAEMEALGMVVRVDNAGNLRGLYAAAAPNAPILLLGSHIDTVPNAGAFDGVLGVALALALLRSLEGHRLTFAIEVIAFSEEEGVRFRLPFLGSRALIGTLGEAELTRNDTAGISVHEAITSFGLDAANIADAALSPRTFAFLEFHIEQGPVLEAANLPLGIVTGIAGQTRLEVTFQGRANHAGTTPMRLRRDALTAAAAWISAGEQYALAVPGLVATVGIIKVTPAAANVVPGTATLSLDVRHEADALRKQAVDALLTEAYRIATLRGLDVDIREMGHQDAVAMDPRWLAVLSDALSKIGVEQHTMVSGAGHDAQILAPVVPTGMLFLRTPDGLSHHPDEAVSASDVERALEAGLALLPLLESSSLLEEAR